MLNYSAHSIPDIRLLCQGSIENERFGDLDNLEWAIEQLRRAPKYILPDGGVFFSEGNGLPEGLSPQRLPYKTIILEMPISRSDGTERKNTKSTKRLMICHEMKQPRDAMVALDLQSHPTDRRDADGFVMINISWYDESKVWFPTAYCSYINYDARVSAINSGDKEILKPGPYPFHETKTGIAATPIMFMPDLGTDLVEEIGLEKALLTWANDTGSELRASLEFLQILACRNVTVREEKPPEKLNKSRIKQGKEPFDSYRLLTVGDVQISGGRSNKPNDGSYKVRQHLRCGHIRRLPTHNIWINDTVVAAGSKKGETHRGYVINTR